MISDGMLLDNAEPFISRKVKISFLLQIVRVGSHAAAKLPQYGDVLPLLVALSRHRWSVYRQP